MATITITTSATTDIVGAGTDTVDFTALTTAVTVDLTAGTVTGGAGTRAISGVTGLIGSTASSADQLTGTSGNDYLDGGHTSGVNDGVKDILNGGSGGNDTYNLHDAQGTDVDTIIDTSGTDTIISSVDRDLSQITNQTIENITLEAGAGDINAYGSSLNSLGNYLTGNEGANILDGRLGSDTMEGGAGDDTYYVKNYTDAVTSISYADTIVEVDKFLGVSQGNDTVVVASSYTLASGVSVENMETENAAGTGGWTLVGNEFVQTITGNNGNNTLDGGTIGAATDGVIDTLIGGAGNDTYELGEGTGSTLDVVTENTGEGTDTIKSSITRTLVDFANIENITLTGSTAANATGVNGSNALTGNSADNVLDGGDTTYDATDATKIGNDTMTGGGGADTFVWDGLARDVVSDFTSAESDKVDLSHVHISEFATVQAIAFASGTTDTILRIVENGAVHTMNVKGLALASMSSSNFTFDTATTNDAVAGTANNDFLFAAGGNDSMSGGAGVDYLFGEAGDDDLDGGAGSDFMYGGAGNDVYHVNSLSDVVVDGAGQGTDTIYTTLTMSLPISNTAKEIEHLGVEGSSINISSGLSSTAALSTNVINLTGNALNNIIAGNDGNNVLNGLTGADTMVGGAGNDVYYVDNAGDQIVDEGAGNGTDRIYTKVSYTIGSGDEVEYLNAWGSTSINLTGNATAQTITGNIANNIINGKTGNDTLWGLGGKDTFVFDTALSGNKDTIKDFSAPDDTIKIDNAIFTAVSGTGILTTAQFYQGTAAHDADDRIVYDRVTGNLMYDADGNGSGAAVTFAVIANKVAMTNADFLVF